MDRSEALVKYMKEHRIPSVTALSSLTGVPRETLGDIIKGRTKGITKTTADKIFQATGLLTFELEGKTISQPSDLGEDLLEQFISSLTALMRLPTLLRQINENEKGKKLMKLLKFWQPSSSQIPPEHRVEKIEKLLTILDAELNLFLEGSREERDILRANLSGPDIGRLTTLLRTLMQEEEKVATFRATQRGVS